MEDNEGVFKISIFIVIKNKIIVLLQFCLIRAVVNDVI